jgi:hypothetical protein
LFYIVLLKSTFATRCALIVHQLPGSIPRALFADPRRRPYGGGGFLKNAYDFYKEFGEG